MVIPSGIGVAAKLQGASRSMRFFYAKINAVVGESERDQGFFLPKLVSAYRECLGLRFQIEWYAQNFQKNENTWYRVLTHYNAK